MYSDIFEHSVAAKTSSELHLLVTKNSFIKSTHTFATESDLQNFTKPLKGSLVTHRDYKEFKLE